MEPHPPYIVVHEPADNKYTVHALHITIDRIPIYKPLRLRYDRMTDAIRGANEATKPVEQYTQRVVDMVNDVLKQ